MINRRTFLAKTAAGLGSVALPLSAFPSIIAPGHKDVLGVALVGLGYYSTDLLAPALQLTKHCRLAGVVTGTPAKAEEWKKRHSLSDKNIFSYADFDRIANSPDIDIVYVVLPPSMHAEYCIRAARAGKHVWCEKPMAMTAAECTGMIDAAAKNKVKLSIGYRMHHEPNTQQIIRFGKEGTYGKVLEVTAAAGYFDGRTNHWKQKKALGGGAMYDMGVYPLNATRYCTGLEPISVSAKGSTTRPDIYTEVEETINFDLEFPGGIKAKGEASFGKGLNDLMVKTEKGWYSLAPFQSYGGIRGEASDGKQLTASIPNQQAKQMDEDALAIKSGTSVLVPGEEGLKDIRVVEAIYRSIKEKKRVQIS